MSHKRSVLSRALGLALFFSCVMNTVFSLAVLAEETTKPAQRKRLGGLKPFTKEQIEDFLSERRNAAIATINKNGAPQLNPVIYYWDGTRFFISVTKETRSRPYRPETNKNVSVGSDSTRRSKSLIACSIIII
jgi:hypothetical protein